ncbi:g1886 [Coccomyxa viridis]|uniref:peptidylprolyl isomerase n=1 Tax=Coccomyxa viridis TaxID=1274662 RepID=A0ABP1FJ15_9CHLO
MRTTAAQLRANLLQCQHLRGPSPSARVIHNGVQGLRKSCRATPRHQSQSRRCFRVQAELPSIPGLADAGLALTEGALPGSADEKRSSQDVASNGSSEAQNGQIKVKEERLANSNMRLEVTVPVEMLQKAKQKALKQLRADADIPGFRKGQKIPDRIIIDDAGGKDVLVGGIVEAALNAALPLALGRYNTKAIEGSERIEEDFAALKGRLDMEKPLIFHVNLDVRQPHSWKMPYKDIKVEVPSIGTPEEDPKTVDLKLRQVQKEKGTMKVATGRPLKMGDIAIVNFQATRTDNNELITGSQQRGMRLDTDLGDRALGIAGVVEGIMGMNVGEKRALESVVGDAWWEPEGLAGVPVRCDVTLREIFEWDLAELTDELVRGAFDGIENLQQLREAFSVATVAQREYDQREKVHEALIKAVADCVDAEVPESVIRQVGENEYQAKLHEMQMKEAMPYEELNKLVNEDLLNQYIESRRAVLAEIELSSVGMNDIFEKEGLKVTDDELRAEVDSVTEEFGQNGQAFDKERLQEQAMEVLKAGKTLEWLEKNVTVVIK